VVVDVGTGDGRFVLHEARRDPAALAVGVDAHGASMAESSRRALRRNAIPNALFVVAAAEALPEELAGRAQVVTVHFPWGSLLRGLVTGSPDVAATLASMAAPTARVDLLLSARGTDRLPWLDAVDERAASAVAARFAPVGFEPAAVRPATAEDVAASHSTWAKRLGAGANGRAVWRVSLRRAARLPAAEPLGETGA
jgi:16S rRNA (adenine(1408)-N(1))-methyltransferase